VVLKTETHKGITSIEFFHPQSNSLPAKILHDLPAIQHAGHDPATIVIILRSAGKALCRCIF
jgi:methylglutaconyl-CoA hydratase